MPDILPVLLSTTLFSGLTREEAQEALTALAPRQAFFDKGEYLLRAGERAAAIGVLLDGRALILQEDFWGNRNILAALGPGQIFAEAFACAPKNVLTVSVEAQSSCHVLFLNTERLLSRETGDNRLLCNLLTDLAGKNLRLNEKLTHMGQPTTRAKVLSYLSSQASGRPEFDIPFSRQQLADYLGVDRSGLSAELGRLRREGILTFHKNYFSLLKNP